MKQQSFKRIALPLLIVTTIAMGLGGCTSDSVAPQDKLPALSQGDLVAQAGYAAYLVANAYGVYQGYLATLKADKMVDTYSFTAGGVSGAFTLDYRCGGAAGTPCDYNDAATNYIHIWTDAGQSIIVRNSSGMTLVTATFDLEVDPYVSFFGLEGGYVTGGGSLVAGLYNVGFTLTDVLLTNFTYPESGSMDYGPGDQPVTVTFDGDQFADLEIDGDLYTVDLDTGEVEEQTTR